MDVQASNTVSVENTSAVVLTDGVSNTETGPSYIISFLLVFLCFTLGGVANVYAFWKIRGAWRRCPLLCNLTFLGAVGCLISAPIYGVDLLANYRFNLQSTSLCLANKYSWTLCEFPLYVNVAAISIQRSRKILTTFNPQTSKTFETIALVSSWLSAFIQITLMVAVDKFSGEDRGCWKIGRNGYIKPDVGMVHQYSSFIMTLMTLTCMITSYSFAICYLRRGVHKTKTARTMKMSQAMSQRRTLGHFRPQTIEEAAVRPTEGPSSFTTVTYMLAKQVLLINGLTGVPFSSSQGAESMTTCVETFPGPSVHPKERRKSDLRRRSSLDVSTIYSVRESEIKPLPQRSAKLSLPGCISPEGEDSATMASTVRRWSLKHNFGKGLGIERQNGGRISEESVISQSRLNSDNWADPITPPYDRKNIPDTFNEALASNNEYNSNRLSPFHGSERMKVLSVSSMSSDGESFGWQSSTSLGSRAESYRQGSKPQEFFLHAFKGSRKSASPDRSSHNHPGWEERSVKETIIKSQLDMGMDEWKTESDNADVPHAPSIKKANKEEGSIGMQTSGQFLDEWKTNSDNMPAKSPEKPALKSLASPKRSVNRVQKSKKHKIKKTMGIKGQGVSQSPGKFLPPLRHERLNASGAPISENHLGEGSSSSLQTWQQKADIQEQTSVTVPLENLPENSSMPGGRNVDTSHLNAADAISQVSANDTGRVSSSQRSEIGIFQFLAESGEKECIVAEKRSSVTSRNVRIARRRSQAHHSDPTGIALTPNSFLKNWSSPALISGDYINPNNLFSRSEAVGVPGRNKGPLKERHNAAYYATRKSCWLISYFFVTMAPIAALNVLPVVLPSSQIFLQSLAYVCLIINPFSYILSNKNLLAKPRTTDFRRNFIS